MFSAVINDHVARPRNTGPLQGATHIGSVGIPGDGPYMTLYFLVEGGVIRQTGYETYGCLAAIGCASVVAEVLIGRTLAQAAQLTSHDVFVLVQGLPEGKGHCADMAAQCIQSAFEGERP